MSTEGKFLKSFLIAAAFLILGASTFVAFGGSIENDALPMAPKRYDELDELPKTVFTSVDGRDPAEGKWGQPNQQPPAGSFDNKQLEQRKLSNVRTPVGNKKNAPKQVNKTTPKSRVPANSSSKNKRKK